MRCVVCKGGETQPGKATVTLERGGLTIVFKSVPASVCSNCGDGYVDEQTSTRLLQAAEEAARTGVRVDIREYVAA